MFTVVQRHWLSINFLEEAALKKSCGMQNLLLSSSLNSKIFALEMNLEKKDETYILREMDMCMSVVYQFLINIKPLTAKINKSSRVIAVT